MIDSPCSVGARYTCPALRDGAPLQLPHEPQITKPSHRAPRIKNVVITSLPAQAGGATEGSDLVGRNLSAIRPHRHFRYEQSTPAVAIEPVLLLH
jgi:hypothetical protein